MGESVEIKLARFEEILRAHCTSQEKITKTMFSKVDDLDERLKILETWQATTKGGWGVLSALTLGGGAVGAFLSKLSGLFGG